MKWHLTDELRARSRGLIDKSRDILKQSMKEMGQDRVTNAQLATSLAELPSFVVCASLVTIEELKPELCDEELENST